MKVAIYTLGCKVNQYETQAMEQLLRERGHQVVDFSQEADAYVVNTCSVTAVSDQKSRQMIRHIRRQRPGAVVAVCGCYPQTHAADMEKLDVDLVSGTGDRLGFLDQLEQAGQSRLEALDRAFDRRAFEILPAGGLENRTRAMLKVEDGCVNFCSYCIIPYARGPVRSLPLEKAVEETKRLAENGYKEIILTGIEISSWGQDFYSEAPRSSKGPSLADLIEAVCAAAPLCRIRLGSLEPRTITGDFCRRVSSLHNLCSHFHLSLQSGCDATLKRMNRKYDTARYYESVELLRKYYVNPGITTDLIVGFPGETEEEFTQTLQFLEKCAFSAMHIFPYSRRPGTPADKMPNQIPNGVKEDRARRAAAVADRLRTDYLQGLVGQTLPVLFEEEKDGSWRGHAPNYAEVWTSSTDSLHNTEKSVQITGVSGSALLGRVL